MVKVRGQDRGSRSGSRSWGQGQGYDWWSQSWGQGQGGHSQGSMSGGQCLGEGVRVRGMRVKVWVVGVR